MVLKYMRTYRNLKQEVIAKSLEIERTTLSGYESGRRQPDFSTIEKIATECNFSIYFVNNVTGEKFQSRDFPRKEL